MTPLDRKLLRDLIHYRGQAAAVALVVLCGLGSLCHHAQHLSVPGGFPIRLLW